MVSAADDLLSRLRGLAESVRRYEAAETVTGGEALQYQDDWAKLASGLIAAFPSLLARIEAGERLAEAAREVWDSVPATYDGNDPTVKRHARALNALPALLSEYERARKEGA